MIADYDVAIIGGGPAGSTAACVLAQSGHNVVLFERERFPRFHIGESLLPYSMATLERIRVLDKVKAAGFVEKHGASFASACSEREVRFYFKNGFRSTRPTAFQVLRSNFDKILLDHAAQSGAEVREETRVTDLEFYERQVHLRVAYGNGVQSDVTCRFVLDCSGRNTVVGTKFDLKREYPGLQKFAVYAHYEGVERPAGVEGTLTRMVRSAHSWFWMIPLSDILTSVGVVLDTSRFRQLGGRSEAVLAACIDEIPLMRKRMKEAKRVTKVYASGDYSYRNTRLTGDRWLLAGDAAGFIDPIFSSGVFLAILGGEKAAEALAVALRDEAAAQREFARYARRISKTMDLYVGFVQSWYTREFVEMLMNPQEFLAVVPAVNAVLAGNTGKSFALRWRVWLFHCLVALQRFLPISPKLALEAAS